MATFLFDKIIFGPVISRRLGQSLGINLLPTDKKICNFDCIYCECGLNENTNGIMPSRAEVAEKLELFLIEYRQAGKKIDTITFAGNGEPTLNKDFPEIIDDTYNLRNTYFPEAKIALLTNSSTIIGSKIRETFRKIDLPILKLDSVNEETIKVLNSPVGNFNLTKIINTLKKINKPIIQSMFIRGTYKNKPIDNTLPQELNPWLKTIKEINPGMVMIYTIDRDTPFDTLKKVPLSELKAIAQKVKNLGIDTQISS